MELTPEHIARALDRPILPTAAQLVALFRRVEHLVIVDLDRSVGPLGVSYAQVEVMEQLHARPGIHGGAIARRLGITRQAAHRLIRQLERGALAERQPFDGFARPVVLTADGDERVKLATQALHASRRAVEQIEPEAKLGLQKGLRALEDVLTPRVERWW